jgi:hypothetical protein
MAQVGQDVKTDPGIVNIWLKINQLGRAVFWHTHCNMFDQKN